MSTFSTSWHQKRPKVSVFYTFDLEMCFAPQQRALFRHLTFQKVVRAWCVLYILTWKCASRHNGVHFFDSATSKSGPHMVCLVHFDLECASRHNGVHFFDSSTSKSGLRMVCFVHFDLDMCFVPQRRALFRQLNFQKWSENGVFCTFWLGHVLRATTACTFSTAQLPKVVWERCVLYILTRKYASRHNGVHFFDSSTSKGGLRMVCFVHFDLDMCFAPQRRALFHLSSGQLARTRCFSDVFDPPEPQIIGKN